MYQFFQFESDFVEALRCIPMQVRYKLDACGVKLKLSQWNHFTSDDRQALVTLPCEAETEIQTYQSLLHQLVLSRTGAAATDLEIDPAPAWLDVTQVPSNIQQKAQEVTAELSLIQWQELTPLQRFTLIKLSRSSHENSNFLPALQEFDLT